MLKNESTSTLLRKSDRTRQHLIDISLNAFKTNGYDFCTMRSLAKEAKITAPAFYYYFGSKEEIVSAYYEQSLETHLSHARKSLSPHRGLEANLKSLILGRIEELSSHKTTLAVFKRFAFDRANPVSPFHASHQNLRQASVDLFAELIEISNIKWPDSGKRDLAQSLWLFHLGILAYWISDESVGFKKTRELLDRSLSHLSTVLMLSRLPGAQKLIQPLFETFKKAELLEDL